MFAENKISKELGVGQPTVREALFALEREGLVERVPNLGTFVRQLGIKEVSYLYQIRAELEGLATELAAQRAKPEDCAFEAACLRYANWRKGAR